MPRKPRLQQQLRFFLVAFCSPAKSLACSGLLENPLVGQKLKFQHPSKMHQSFCFDADQPPVDFQKNEHLFSRGSFLSFPQKGWFGFVCFDLRLRGDKRRSESWIQPPWFPQVKVRSAEKGSSKGDMKLEQNPWNVSHRKMVLGQSLTSRGQSLQKCKWVLCVSK